MRRFLFLAAQEQSCGAPRWVTSRPGGQLHCRAGAGTGEVMICKGPQPPADGALTIVERKCTN